MWVSNNFCNRKNLFLFEEHSYLGRFYQIKTYKLLLLESNKIVNDSNSVGPPSVKQKINHYSLLVNHAIVQEYNLFQRFGEINIRGISLSTLYNNTFYISERIDKIIIV